MKQIIKSVQQIGNGGHIYLPKEMVGHKVIITLVGKSMDDVKEEVLLMLKPYLVHIKGIYLHGSYARGEQTAESDIDILAITDGKIKIKRRVNEYDIMSISEESIKKALKHTAVLILPIIKELKPILNQELVEKYKNEKLTKQNTKWYIETTDSSLKLAENWLSEKDKKSIPHIIYPLMLRLRGLYMIECLVKGMAYSNKELERYIASKGLSQDEIKQISRIYKEQRDKKTLSSYTLDCEPVCKLYKIVYSYFKEVRLLWEKLR